MRLCIHVCFMRVNDAGSNLYNVKAGKIYKSDCYKATFANMIAKRAIDVRIIIVNRAKITLVVLAQRIIFLHFSCFRAFFL